MKFRMMLSALLLAAGLVFVTGCDKKADASKGGDKSEKKADTPTEVVVKLMKALKTMDWETAAKLSSGKMKDEANVQVARLKDMLENIKTAAKNGNEKAKDLLRKYESGGFIEILKDGAENGDAKCQKALADLEGMNVETKGENIDGDFATVDVIMTKDGKTEEDKAYLKKVDGEWKVIDESEYKK